MSKLNLCEGIYGTDELEVLVGETQVIIPVQERSFPCGFVFKLLDGEIVVSGAMSGVDWPADRSLIPLPPGQHSSELSWRRSKDGGQTWHESPAWPSYSTYQFPDGEIIQISNRWWQMEKGQKSRYSFALFCSIDNGYTFKKNRVSVVDTPKLAKVEYRYSDKERSANLYHQIVRLRDGSLLASAQGKFESDIKERSFTIQSYDRGKTWKYLSTVAFDLVKDGGRFVGFAEPSLLSLPNGDIICFMRSSGGYGGQSSHRCGFGLPIHRGLLYVSRSRDDGKTWSHADPVADRGVYPSNCLMENGTIAMVYGRPGDWLTFSLDQGETWINHFCFNQTPNPYDCGNYDWIEEIAPDKLLVIYCRTDPNDCLNTEIMGKYFTVKPKKKV